MLIYYHRDSNLATRASNLLTCCFSSTTKVASLSNIGSCRDTLRLLLRADCGNVTGNLEMGNGFDLAQTLSDLTAIPHD
jgi:hypothetical protein